MRYTCSLLRVTLVVIAIALPSPAVLAQSDVVVAVSAGSVTDQFGQRANAVGIAPRLAFMPTGAVVTRLGASAARLGGSAWSLGAAGDLEAREALAGGLAVSIAASAGVTRLDAASRGTYAVADVTPALEFDVSRVSLFAGLRLAGGSATEERRSPTLPLGTQTTRSQLSRSGRGPSAGVQVALSEGANTTVVVGARVERLVVAPAVHVDRRVTLRLRHGGTLITGSAGTRSTAGERQGVRDLAATLPMTAAIAIELSASRYAGNPLLGTPGGDHVSVGFSLRAPRQREWTPPRAAAPAAPRGATRLAIRAPDATIVEIAGDFTEWTPVRATRASNGVWYADFRIAPGRYRYAFRVNGSEWTVPDGATAVDDGFGGKSAWLTVSEPAKH